MEQQQNVQVEEGVSLADVFKLLLSHLKLLILVMLIGAVLGGAFSVWRTYDVNYYGSEVQFYVNPKKSEDGSSENESQFGVYGAYGRHVMDNMVKLLGSESFFEQMILSGEKLPEKDVWTTEKEESSLKLNEKIDAAAEELVKLNDAQKVVDEATVARTTANETYTEANSDLNAEWNLLYLDDQNTFKTATFNESLYKQLQPTLTGSEYTPLHDAYEARKTAKESLDTANDVLTEAKLDRSDVQKVTSGVVENALDAWRKTSKYKSSMSQYKSSVSFNFLLKDEDIENANDLARSFIYVEINVLNDEKFANTLLEKVKKFVPLYVEENMTVPTGYEGTNCRRTTRTDDIVLTNPNYTMKEAVKYALLVGLAALVVACVVIIIVDKSDKRLRDPEQIAKKFNVPLLGIVPAIDELYVEDSNQQKTERTSTEVK